MNSSREVVLLPREDETAWLLRTEGDGVLSARLLAPGGPCGPGIALGSGRQGWDAVLDSTGTAWAAYIGGDGHNVYVRKAVHAEWGPAFQVSSSSGIAPFIRADEFGNVWISWKARTSDGHWEIRVCRMGPRSGQEMIAATFDAEPAYLDAGTRGGVLWQIARTPGGPVSIVTGTEHGGFGPSVPLA
jgi:hypothetical protein